MTDGVARSVDLPRAVRDRRPVLRLVGEDEAGADRARLPQLTWSADLFGIGPAGWAGGGIYVALAVASMFLTWQVTAPVAWPEDDALFSVVFEAPPAPAPALVELLPAPPEPASPPPEAVAPPEPALPLPVVMAEPAEILPLPPPPKPEPRPAAAHALVPAPMPAPARAIEVPAEPAPAPQTAAVAVIPPQPISGLAGNRKPEYPQEARRRGLQGKVLLRVEVSAQGLPLSVAVATSSGYGALDQAALAAVERWRFSPATRNGTPVAGAAEVPIQFRLEE